MLNYMQYNNMCKYANEFLFTVYVYVYVARFMSAIEDTDFGSAKWLYVRSCNMSRSESWITRHEHGNRRTL